MLVGIRFFPERIGRNGELCNTLLVKYFSEFPENHNFTQAKINFCVWGQIIQAWMSQLCSPTESHLERSHERIEVFFFFFPPTSKILFHLHKHIHSWIYEEPISVIEKKRRKLLCGLFQAHSWPIVHIHLPRSSCHATTFCYSHGKLGTSHIRRVKFSLWGRGVLRVHKGSYRQTHCTWAGAPGSST